MNSTFAESRHPKLPRTPSSKPFLPRLVHGALALVLIIGVAILIGCGGGGGGGGGGSSSSSPVAVTTGGSISGKILRPLGNIVASPLTDLRGSTSTVAGIEVWVEEYPNIRAQTASSGAYLLSGIPQGAVHVVAKDQTGTTLHKTRSATAISVTQGSMETLEMTVAPALIKVIGILRTADGKPLPIGSTMSLWGETFTVQADGRFETPALPEGFPENEIVVHPVGSALGIKILATFVPGASPAMIEAVLPSTTSLQHPPIVNLAARVGGQLSSTANPGEAVTITAHVQDAEDLEWVTAEWECSLGTLTETANPFVRTWTAPLTGTLATISVLVTDSDGATGKAQLNMYLGGNPPSSEKALSRFAFVSPVMAATIDSTSRVITAILPAATDRRSLIADFSTSGWKVLVNGREQKSGITANDFSSPITYSIVAEDGTSLDYFVYVTCADAVVASGKAVVIGAPPAITATTTAEFRIGGTGITAYRYSVDEGNWTAEAPMTTGILLFDLAPGKHTLAILGRDGNGAWQDESEATYYSWTIATSLLSVTVDQDVNQPDPTNGTSATFLVLFSAPVTGFTSEAINLDGTTVGGTKTVTVTGSGALYTVRVAVGGISSEGVFKIAVKPSSAIDRSGNRNQASRALDDRVTRDTTAPVVMVTTLMTGDTTPALNGKVDDPAAEIRVTIEGAEYPGVNLGNGTWMLPDDAISVPLSSGTHDVAVSAKDIAGNVGRDYTTGELKIDPAILTATLNQRIGQVDPTNKDVVEYTIIFSKPVVDFEPGAIDLSETTAGGSRTVTLTGTGTTFVARVSLSDGPSLRLSDGVIRARIPSGVVHDLAGNTNAATVSSDNEITRDTLPPGVTVQNTTTSDSRPALSGTIDDLLASVTVIVNGASFTAENRRDGTWLLADDKITPELSNGVYAVDVRAIDRAGNLGVARSEAGLTIDTGSLQAVIDQKPGQRDPTTGSQFEFAISFNRPVTDFDRTKLDFNGTTAGGTRTVTILGTGASFTVRLVLSGVVSDGLITCKLLPGTIHDAARNVNSGLTILDNRVTRDTVAPSISVNRVTTGDTTPSMTGTVSDLLASVSVIINKITYAALNNGDGTWTLVDDQITQPLAAGKYEVEASAIDAAGNIGRDVSALELTVDPAALTVTINQKVGQPDPTSLNVADFVILFSKSVSDFDLSAIDLSETTAGGSRTVTLSGTGMQYAVRVALDGAPTDGVIGIVIPAGKAHDSAGNGNLSSTNVDNRVTRDTQPPVITIATLTTSDTRPPLSGTVDDGSATVHITVDGRQYTAINDGNGTWTLPDDRISYALKNGITDVIAVATDKAGNVGRDATTGELTIDANPLTVTISRKPGQPDTIIGRQAEFLIVFNKAISGFGTGMINTAETTAGTIESILLSGEGATYTAKILVQEPANDGVIKIKVDAGNIRDIAGNWNTASSNPGNWVTRDTTPPRVTVLTTFTNDTRPPLNGTVNEASATISVSVNGTWYVAVNNRNGTWTLPDNMISTALSDGVYDILVQAVDGSGNSGTSTNTAALTIDSVAPTLTISQATGQSDPTRLNQAEFQVVFSEPVMNFDFNKIDLSGATIGGTRTLTVLGTGTTYLVRLAISGVMTDGFFKIKVNAGVVRDAAGNWNTAATIIDSSVTRDSVPPIVSVKGLTTGDATPALSGSINELLATVTVTVGGNQYTAVNNRDGTWTLPDDSITPFLPDGVYDVQVQAVDAAGNTGSDSTTRELIINAALLTATVSVKAGQPNPTKGNDVDYLVLFGRPVADFDATDVDLSDSTVGGSRTVSISGTGASYTVRVSLGEGATDGMIRMRINASAAHDINGYGNAASNNTGNAVERDTVAPGSPSLNAVVSPTYLSSQTLTGSKPVAADMVLVNGTGTGVLYPTSTSWRYEIGLSQGLNQLRIVSSDLAGNESSPILATIDYDPSFIPVATKIELTPVGGTVITGMLNSSNTNLTGKAVIVPGVMTNGEAELLIDGASFFPAVKDTSISASDTIVTFDCFQASTSGLQSMIPRSGVLSVRLKTQGGITCVSSVGNPSLTVDYSAPSAPVGLILMPIGGTITANTLNETNTNLQARATILAGEATGGEAELLLDGVSFTPPVKDSSIGAYDSTITFDLNQSSVAGVQAIIKSGGVMSVRLRDAAGNLIVSTIGNPSLSVTYTVPRVKITTDSENPTTSLGTITCLIQFSEDVTEFTSADLALENCVIDDFFGFGATYAVDLAITGSGNPRIWVPANVAANAAGIGNAATSACSIVVKGTDGTDVAIDSSIYVLVPRTTLPDGTVVPAFYCGKFPATVGSEDASGSSYLFDVTYQFGGDGKRHRAATNSIGRPWVFTSWNDAKRACAAAGCGLISENQWLAIAHSTLGVAANWRNGASGSTEVSGGGYYRGLSNSSVTKAQPAYGGDPGGSPGTTSVEYRGKRLPNNAEIWDIGGNVWQWVDGYQATGTWYTGCSASGWYETNQSELTLSKIKTTFSSSHGVGKIYNYSGSSARPLVRGGSWGSFTISGAFSLILDVDMNTGFRDFGFRCVR